MSLKIYQPDKSLQRDTLQNGTLRLQIDQTISN